MLLIVFFNWRLELGDSNFYNKAVTKNEFSEQENISLLKGLLVFQSL